MQLVGMIKLLSGGLQKKFGGPKQLARTALEDGCDRKKPYLIFDPRFALYFLLFSSFFQKSQNRRFCFMIFSMKNVLIEKMENSTMNSMEKAKK